MKIRSLTQEEEQKLANIREVFIDGRECFEKIDAGYERFLANPRVQSFFLSGPMAGRYADDIEDLSQRVERSSCNDLSIKAKI